MYNKYLYLLYKISIKTRNSSINKTKNIDFTAIRKLGSSVKEFDNL
jgi:hypothetical protein